VVSYQQFPRPAKGLLQPPGLLRFGGGQLLGEPIHAVLELDHAIAGDLLLGRQGILLSAIPAGR
jgi:hypothetical protein